MQGTTAARADVCVAMGKTKGVEESVAHSIIEMFFAMVLAFFASLR
jgi:hypothetical protein